MRGSPMLSCRWLRFSGSEAGNSFKKKKAESRKYVSYYGFNSLHATHGKSAAGTSIQWGSLLCIILPAGGEKPCVNPARLLLMHIDLEAHALNGWRMPSKLQDGAEGLIAWG